MNDSHFGHYTLSNYALDKLAELDYRSDINSDEIKLWKSVAQEVEDINEEQNKDDEEDDEQLDKSSSDTEVVASQFYFSQSTNATSTLSETSKNETSINENQDGSKLLHECLENLNGTFDLNLFKGLSTSAVAETLENLNKRLTMTGLHYVLKAMTKFDSEEGIAYLDVICNKLVLPKLNEIDIKERLVKDQLVDLTEKYPEQIQKNIYIPSLNLDLERDYIIVEIIKTLGPEKHDALLTDFTTHANEIKSWHFSVIQILISTPINITSKNHLIQMFLDKCTVFSGNADFGKLMVAFVKAGAPFTDDETNILKEIADTHSSSIKRSLNNSVNKLKN